MKSRLLGAVSACVFTLVATSTSANLVSRLGGQAVYDTDLEITWLADANLAATNTFGVAGINANGSMDWFTANSWITAMNADGGTGYLGFTDWRLSILVDQNDTCPSPTCTNGNEMGHLFYTELSGTANNPILTSGDPDLALFSNIQTQFFDGSSIVDYNYWTGADQFSGFAWDFSFGSGDNDAVPKNLADSRWFTWAVRSGDVSAVPVPPAVWLFGSGLLGLIGIARRKAA